MDSVPITYELGAYEQLDRQLQAQPELYVNRYFAEHFYECALAGKRKLEQVESASEDASNSVINRERQYVRMAPNNSHPLLDAELKGPLGEIVKVEFADNVVNSVIKGKSKKQSLRLTPDTKLCTIHTANDKQFIVRAAVKGKLMEWNQRLESDPGLVQRSPEQGFIAIIKPNTDDNSKILEACV
ncbi:hypothetical protein IWW40_000284 [Coemansia sp. RSA 1250]|nr:hypothetical protein LPJ68_004106 [Coemansia sp. RSA 1086]KAJ2653590.1 hypothetical protein IWW40_000284 [Coemansia sp. RSA 1250]